MTHKALKPILVRFEKAVKELYKAMNMLSELELTHDITKQVKKRKSRVIQDAPVANKATKKAVSKAVSKAVKQMGRPRKSKTE